MTAAVEGFDQAAAAVAVNVAMQATWRHQAVIEHAHAVIDMALAALEARRAEAEWHEEFWWGPMQREHATKSRVFAAWLRGLKAPARGSK